MLVLLLITNKKQFFSILMDAPDKCTILLKVDNMINNNDNPSSDFAKFIDNNGDQLLQIFLQ